MIYVGLFFVGAVYFINGLSLLGHIDARSAAPMNLMIGVFLLAVAGFILLPVTDLSAPTASTVMFSSVGEVLFAFTFLYVGIGNYINDSGAGLSWYCGWSCIVSLGIALLDVFQYGDFKSASLWGVWVIVFAAFFALGVLRTGRITRATGWFVVVAGFTTCFYPGALQILGRWQTTPSWQIETACLATVGLFFILIVRSYASHQYVEAGA